MARGRHRRRSRLLSRLLPGLRRSAPRPPVRSEVELLQAEVERLRSLVEVTAAAAAAALVRAARAEDLAVAAAGRAARAEERVVGMSQELTGLRTGVGAVREELVWAFAEGRLPVEAAAAVVDLRGEASYTA